MLKDILQHDRIWVKEAFQVVLGRVRFKKDFGPWRKNQVVNTLNINFWDGHIWSDHQGVTQSASFDSKALAIKTDSSIDRSNAS